MLEANTLVDTKDGQVKIADIDIQRYVKTPRGLFEFDKVEGSQELMPMVKVTFADGRCLTCTPDQRLFTRRGWVRADKCARQYCLAVTTKANYHRILSVEDAGLKWAWKLDVKHYEQRYSVNGGVIVANEPRKG